ncbi:hypothetical protein CCACVL1_20910 [Corchorus capsularis]|uniref:Uncharacterized protein n=1 Tax=Corchorus capsularis TaxID=210143 RepID=A0A1R3H9L5_COCAP|nr:hypothetical protein CCACVL1_20910 [Corchorus capsularis]
MLGLGGEGEYSNSSENELSGEIAGKLNVLMTESDDESDFSSEGLVTEEKLEEIMQELYREITIPSSYYTSPPPTVTLTSPSSSSSSPSVTSPFSLSSLPFFAVSDVQSESCGASMSNTASTVMAGIEFVGPAGNFSDVTAGLPEAGDMGTIMVVDENLNVEGESEGVIMGEEIDEKMDGCDEGEVGDDDQWLARVLGWGPLELDEWT